MKLYAVVDANTDKVLELIHAMSAEQAIRIYCADYGYRINLYARAVNGGSL